MTPQPEVAALPHPWPLGTWRDWLAMSRPGVLLLVLMTAPPALWLGQATGPTWPQTVGTLVGLALLGAGCSVLNAWWERERDRRMDRTADRPLPAGRIAPGAALAGGLGLSAGSLAVLGAVGGWLPAALGLATLVHYLGVYTAWLKPRTSWNIVIGGAAGGTAPLIADAVVRGSIGPWSVVLFALIVLWTPPHFWAIALYRRREYAAAGVPMLPGVAGAAAARRQMRRYGEATVATSALLLLAPGVGWITALGGLAGGGLLLSALARAAREDSDAGDRRAFGLSNLYLLILFGALLVDVLADVVWLALG